MGVDLTCVFQNGALADGDGTAAACNGLASYSMDVQGPGGGATINFEGLVANLGGAAVTWRSVAAYPVAGGAAVNSTTGAGLWIVSCAGLASVRARISSYGSGTIYVQGYGSYAPRW